MTTEVKEIKWRIQDPEGQRGMFHYDKEHSRNTPFDYNTQKHISWEAYQARLAKEHQHHLELFGRECWVYKCKCSVCGEEFYAKMPGYLTYYCSGRCRNDAFLERRRQYKKAVRSKQCPVCGEQFQAKRRDAVFCSARCKAAAHRQLVNDNCSGQMSQTKISNNVTDKCSTDLSTTQNGNKGLDQTNDR